MPRFLLVLPLVLLMAAGCVRARGNTRLQPSPLDVPPPPPRVIVPPEPEEPPEEKVTEEPESTAKRPVRPRPQPSREPRTEAAKPPEKPETPPSEAAPPPAAPAVSAPLQPVLPATPREMDRQVIQQLAQAKKDLDRIDYKALSADGRSQYDQAKRFIEQATQAQRDGNRVFAAKLAEKAVGLAAGLVAR